MSNYATRYHVFTQGVPHYKSRKRSIVNLNRINTSQKYCLFLSHFVYLILYITKEDVRTVAIDFVSGHNWVFIFEDKTKADILINKPSVRQRLRGGIRYKRLEEKKTEM